jgi:hypothetical protein
VKSLFSDQPWIMAFSPLALLVPAFTLSHWLNEIRFCKKWTARMERGEKRTKMLWDMDTRFEANWAS